MEKQLIEIAMEILGIDSITINTQRKDIEEWDSLAHVMLISEINDQMGITVPVSAVDTIKTLKDFLNYAKQ